MVEQTLHATEPIPGYRLTERIGAGGYGVVWKADAPGGLTKAIKFVYGKLDDTRAAREMKALERIKQVRHPFLLSLERIEIVDGQLLVVTELADMCLMDRFEACTKAGLPGIPRDELLAYLRDAADALDYMSENFSLQHLDVKPENLLLVGGRIKVADFGLIKDLHELSASMIGGFTPIYAPPEAFDGRASRHSDQYSLAVLYQEMLTGVLPFPGKTAAQLTSQHLNSKPMLSPSPPKDRPILERALEKNPEKRFDSCRELVEQLGKAGQDDASAPSLRKSTTEGPGNPSVNTVVVESQSPRRSSEASVTSPRVTSAPVRNAPSDSAHRIQRQSIDFKTQVAGSRSQPATLKPPRRQALAELPPIEDLPPLDLSDAQPTLRPTLLLGIGGTAGQTLRQLRRRLHDQFGNLAKVPALRMLLLDTDVKALHQATQGEPTARFDVQETLALPLRRPQDYRGSSKQVLKWLSRRWLYNIPRSLQTEGLRPLGRLAFSDHAGTVFDRLRNELLHLTEPEALTASSEATGIEMYDSKPRIFVVASISGGTGGGIALDLAYAVRQILLERGRPSEDVHLVLAHSTGNLQGAKVMADVNAYAFLSELNHFTQNGGDYPGDSTCELASLPGEAARFPDSYLVHLGENLSDTEFESATDAVAEFLYGNLVQASHAFFDRARQSIRHSGESFSSQVPLRTFGIWQSGVDEERILSEQAESLCRRLLRQWSKSGQETTPPEASRSINLVGGNEYPDGKSVASQTDFDAAMNSQVRQLGLDLDGLCDQIQRFIEEAAQRSDRNSQDPSESCAAEVTLNPFVKRIAKEKSSDLCHGVLELIDSPQERIGGARRASAWLNAYLKDLRGETQQLIERLEVERDEQAQALRDSSSFSRKLPSLRKSTGKSIADPTDEQRPLHQRILVLTKVNELLQTVTAEITALGDELQAIGHEIDQMLQTFGHPAAENDSEEDEGRHRTETLSDALHRSIRQRQPELLAELDRRCEASYLEEHGGLYALATKATEFRRTLPPTLRATARVLIHEALREIDVAELLLDLHHEETDLKAWLEGRLEDAEPRWISCARGRRLLLVLPEGTSGEQLRQTIEQDFNAQPSTLIGPTGQILFCYEAEGLSLPHVARQLAEDREDCEAIARRVHTRSDIDWSSLDGP